MVLPDLKKTFECHYYDTFMCELCAHPVSIDKVSMCIIKSSILNVFILQKHEGIKR